MEKKFTAAKAIGRVVRARRNKYRITLQRVAKETGVSVGVLSRFERGAANVSLDVMDTICHFLQIDLGRVRGLRCYRPEEGGE